MCCPFLKSVQEVIILYECQRLEDKLQIKLFKHGKLKGNNIYQHMGYQNGSGLYQSFSETMYDERHTSISNFQSPLLFRNTTSHPTQLVPNFLVSATMSIFYVETFSPIAQENLMPPSSLALLIIYFHLMDVFTNPFFAHFAQYLYYLFFIILCLCNFLIFFFILNFEDKCFQWRQQLNKQQLEIQSFPPFSTLEI